MWTCGKCGRIFKNTNQHHFCGGDPTTVDEYIDSFDDDVRMHLIKVRETIRSAAPDAQERISWRMPTFWQGENLIHFAAFKKHLSIFPGDLTRLPFETKLAEYTTSKGGVQFPFEKPIPYDLITEITEYRVLAAAESVKNRKKAPKKQKIDEIV